MYAWACLFQVCLLSVVQVCTVFSDRLSRSIPAPSRYPFLFCVRVRVRTSGVLGRVRTTQEKSSPPHASITPGPRTTNRFANGLANRIALLTGPAGGGGGKARQKRVREQFQAVFGRGRRKRTIRINLFSSSRSLNGLITTL